MLQNRLPLCGRICCQITRQLSTYFRFNGKHCLENTNSRPVLPSNDNSAKLSRSFSKAVAQEISQDKELEEESETSKQSKSEQIKEMIQQADHFFYNNSTGRRKGKYRPVHSWEISARYMESDAYRETYGSKLVWQVFRRNVRGSNVWTFPGYPEPRDTCVHHDGRYLYNYCCPICRDEYLVIDFRNPKLFMQFLLPGTQELLPSKQVHICKKQYQLVQVHLLKAREHGFLEFPLSFRNYAYSEYYPWWSADHDHPIVLENTEDMEQVLSERLTSFNLYPAINPDVKRIGRTSKDVYPNLTEDERLPVYPENH